MKISLLLALALLTTRTTAQPNPYPADLATLRSILQQTKSYKAQIKGDKLTAYNLRYRQLAADSTNAPESFQYFYNLSQLLLPIRDNHLGFYQYVDFTTLKSRSNLDSFIASRERLAYPVHQIDVDSLKAALTNVPADSVEGIYQADSAYSIGLFKSSKNEYTGVIVDTKTKTWRKGQVAMRLYRSAPRQYSAITAIHARKPYGCRQTRKSPINPC